MMLPTTFCQAGPLWRVQALLQTWALGRPGSFDLMFVDFRLALVTFVARSLLDAADAGARHFMGRAWQGARFAQDITAAATMVAAAGR
jgi:hypothetical protein